MSDLTKMSTADLVITSRAITAELRARAIAARVAYCRTMWDRPVSELGPMSVRTANCLMNAGFETIGQLVESTESQLLRSRNFGPKSLNEVKDILSDIGLELGMRP